MLKVKGHPDLYRDSTSNGIINSDREALLIAKRRKQEILQEKQRIDNIEIEVKEIKDTLKEILKLLSPNKDD